jgi:formate-dependent nitrite reductase membrane component NrfD
VVDSADEGGPEQGWDLYDDADEWGRGTWSAEPERPPRPWPRSSPAYLLVIGIGGVGLVLMALVGWGQAAEELFRPGALLVGAAVCLAAVLRAALSEPAAGMLVLRSRRLDVVVYLVLGVAALVLAILVPPPS